MYQCYQTKKVVHVLQTRSQDWPSLLVVVFKKCTSCPHCTPGSALGDISTEVTEADFRTGEAPSLISRVRPGVAGAERGGKSYRGEQQWTPWQY